MKKGRKIILNDNVIEYVLCLSFPHDLMLFTFAVAAGVLFFGLSLFRENSFLLSVVFLLVGRGNVLG